MASARGSAPPKPLLVELVGAPGAGKSTVFESLLSRDERIESRPVLNKRSDAGLIARSLVAVLMMLLRDRRLWRSIGNDLRELTYMRALPRVLEGRPEKRIVVFDQGPIFYLTRPNLFDERLERWWTTTFDTWSSLVDVVVWLEAPDAVLVQRINARSKVHRVKGSHADIAGQFLAESRAVYDDAIGRLDGRGAGPIVLRFDTSRRSADQVVDEILATLARLRAGSDRRPAPNTR